MDIGQIQNLIGGKINGEQIEEATCPECGNAKSGYLYNDRGVPWMSCNRKNNCPLGQSQGKHLGQFFPDHFKDGNKKISREEIKLNDCVRYLRSRGLSGKLLPNMKPTTSCIKKQGHPDTFVNGVQFHLDNGAFNKRFPETLGEKVRGTGPHSAGVWSPYAYDYSKAIVMTEGCLDAVALIETIGVQVAGIMFSGVKPGNLVSFWNRHLQHIKKNKTTIILAFDNDKAGQNMTSIFSDFLKVRHIEALISVPPLNDWVDTLGAGGLDRECWTVCLEEGTKFEVKSEKDEKKPKKIYDDYVDFFESKLETPRRCPLAMASFHMDPDREEWVCIKEADVVKKLRSYVHDIENMPASRVDDHLTRWSDSLDKELLIDIPQWDGKDHIGELASHLTARNVSRLVIQDAFRTWMAGVFNRVKSNYVYNQFIILGGGQGIGKDEFIKELFKGFGPYYASVNPQNQKRDDNYTQIHGKMISYTEEIERSNFSPSDWKEYISAAQADYRSPYDRIGSRKKLRHSVIGSTNHTEKMLKDTTGNRRYWIIDVESINWDYKSKVDHMQIVAQAKALSDASYTCKDSTHAAFMGWNEEHKPDAKEDQILQAYMNSERFIQTSVEWIEPSCMHFRSWIDDMRISGFNQQTCRAVLGNNGLRQRVRSGKGSRMTTYLNPRRFYDLKNRGDLPEKCLGLEEFMSARGPIGIVPQSLEDEAKVKATDFESY